MSPRALKRLGAAFAALAVAWAAALLAERRAERPTLLFPAAASARRLSLSGPRGATSLERDGGRWKVVKPFAYPADSSKVADFLDALAGARLSGPLSDDPARYGLFGVDDDSATRVTLETADGRRLDVRVGLAGASAGSAFLRRVGSETVREEDGVGRWRFDPTPAAWADDTVAAVDVRRLTRLTLVSPKGRVVLLQDGGRWRREGAKAPLGPAATKALQPLLESLGRLEADEVDAASGPPPARPELEVVAEGLKPTGEGTETVLRLRAGPIGKDYRHTVWVDGKPDVTFKLAGWRLDPFRLSARDLAR